MRLQLGRIVSWSKPRGGFFLWARVDGVLSIDSLLKRAVAKGVEFVPGRLFFVDEHDRSQIRLSFSAGSPTTIEEGIRRMGEAVHDELTARPDASVGAAELAT